jgi:PAS domain S-box-containing protein
MKNGPSKEFLEERLASTEADLQKSLIQTDTALKYAEQVWWSWNLARKRLKIRSVGDCILGYGQHDMDHGEQFWWDRMHPEDIKEVEESLQACFDGKVEVWRCEHRLRDVGGEWVWVEESGFVLRRDADGNPVEMAGTTRKVQERYQLLDLFRGSESVIDAMLETAPVSFWIRDPEGVVLLASRHMKTRFSDRYGELLEESLCLAEELEAWREAFHKALHGDLVQRKLTLRPQSGDTIQHAHHLIPVPLDTTPFGVLEIFIPEQA